VIPLEMVFIVAGVCLIIEGFFSGTEIAVASADRARLVRLAEAGSQAAKLALSFRDNPQRLLATTLVGTNVALVTSTTVVALAVSERGFAEALAVACMVPALLVLGEIVPRTLCQQHADRWVTRLVYPLRLASILFSPAVLFLGGFAAFAARLLKVEEREALVTRDELRILLESQADSTAIPEVERTMLSKVLDFGDRTVYDVMVPLSEVTALPEDATLEEAAGEAADKQHTRLPIYRERIDQIVGVVHAFDLLTAETAGRKGTAADVARPPIYVPESKSTVDLLLELQGAGQQLAIVVDEYGGAVGICTIEDILEEIVGEIEDEYDRGPSPIRPEGPGLWRILARTRVAQVNQALGLELPEGEDYETLGGLILDRLKRIPKEGDSLRLGPATITIVGVSERAIEEVRIRVGKKR
jgi:putative hemolysin